MGLALSLTRSLTLTSDESGEMCNQYLLSDLHLHSRGSMLRVGVRVRVRGVDSDPADALRAALAPPAPPGTTDYLP